MLIPHFFKRSNLRQAQIVPLKLEANYLRWNSRGGPEKATLSGAGSENDAWALVDYLRDGVEIYDDEGRCCWWGYVSLVQVQVGVMQYEVSLDRMYNRVSVAYTVAEPGNNETGTQATTNVVNDSESQAEYGIKEYVVSAGNISGAAADKMRDIFLGLRRFPRGGFNYSGIVESGDILRVTVECKGWMETLGWRLGAMVLPQQIVYHPVANNKVGIGMSSSNTKIAQSFLTGAQAINAQQVIAKYSKNYNPEDNLLISLQTDSNGVASGTVLASVTISAVDLPTSVSQITSTFVPTVTLDRATTYWIVWERSGDIDGTNYVMVMAQSPGSYDDGVFKTWDGAHWYSNINNAWFTVGVDDNTDSLKQIVDMAATYGALLLGTEMEPASGVTLPAYRDGMFSALTEIGELMDMGGPNDRGLLCEVSQARRLRVWEEPASTEVDYYMDRLGRLMTGTGDILAAHLWPVGVYVRLKNMVGATVNLFGSTIDPALQFLEAVEWRDGTSQPVFRGAADGEDLFGLE